jgi:hypothetical protein
MQHQQFSVPTAKPLTVTWVPRPPQEFSPAALAPVSGPQLDDWSTIGPRVHHFLGRLLPPVNRQPLPPCNGAAQKGQGFERLAGCTQLTKKVLTSSGEPATLTAVLLDGNKDRQVCVGHLGGGQAHGAEQQRVHCLALLQVGHRVLRQVTIVCCLRPDTNTPPDRCPDRCIPLGSTRTKSCAGEAGARDHL